MENTNGEGNTLDGQSVDDAVMIVLDRNGVTVDESGVRTALDLVSEDGVVRRGTVDDAIADVSMRVSNADGRVEYAAVEFEETAGAVDDVTHLSLVAETLADFESRVESLQTAQADLEADLQGVVDRDRDSADLWDLARDMRTLVTRANDIQQRADRLNAELDQFEAWVENVERKFDDLDTDLHTVADDLDDIAVTIDEIETGVEGSNVEFDPAAAWFETTLQHRVRKLVLADVRDELAGARELAEYRDAGLDRADEVETRLADVRDRWEQLGDRLDDLTRPAWTDRFGDDLAAAEETFDEQEPPIDWAVVEETLEAYRPQ